MIVSVIPEKEFSEVIMNCQPRDWHTIQPIMDLVGNYDIKKARRIINSVDLNKLTKEAKDRLPRQDIVITPKTENRLFFVDKRYEQGLPLDENESFYIGKSIAGLKLNQSAQNPITYLNPC